MITYRTFDHTADLGIEVYGRTQEELFVHAGEALADLLADRKGKADRTVRICATGEDGPDLLVNFLREILYQFHGNRLLLGQIRITTLEENKICAEARGEILDPTARKRLRREIKAVTYHQASLRRGRSGRWTARVILDV